jgi:TonB family protein
MQGNPSITMKTPLQFASFLIFCGLAFPYSAPASAPPDPTPTPPKIVQTVAPVFPLELERSGIRTGKVKIVIKVDKTGKLEDMLVTEYSQRLLADEVAKAVKQWTFGPALVGTEPTGWVHEINFYFRRDGILVLDQTDVPMARVDTLVHNDDTLVYHAYSLRDLDKTPLFRHFVKPEGSLWPGAGDVTIDFYIDEEGRVRIPVARPTSDAEFANAAVDAVSQWQFEPPTCKGKPVLVHAVQIFTIKPEKPSKE